VNLYDDGRTEQAVSVDATTTTTEHHATQSIWTTMKRNTSM
jgi:hypothetical protein